MIAPIHRRHKVAIIAGARTPLAKVGTALKDMPMTELAKAVIQETLHRQAWPVDEIDEVIIGNVVMPADAANPARVAALQAGIPPAVPALTVQRNCASGMEAIVQASSLIRSRHAQVVLAGGAESMSSIPLMFPLETLEPITRLAKARTFRQKLTALANFRPRHFKPVPALLLGLTDPLCNMIMGKTAEVLAHEFNITRSEQDEFSLQSHRKAVHATKNGHFDGQIFTIYAGKRFKPVTQDIGPREEQTLAALGKLKPIFDRRDGTVTVGNSCQITDGAAAVLIVDDQIAHAGGHEPLGYIRATANVGLDPSHMGLGPVYAINKVLMKAGLELSDIGLFEINEAFAAQVLACLKAANSNSFCREHFGRNRPLGEVDQACLNVNGGAIALGHPVGASGTRIVLNLILEMKKRNVQYGIASLCVAGGQGAAILMERE